MTSSIALFKSASFSNSSGILFLLFTLFSGLSNAEFLQMNVIVNSWIDRNYYLIAEELLDAG